MRTPGQQQAERVAEIVAGIRQQRDGISRQAVDGLCGDEREVQQRRDGEGKAEVRWRVRMAVIVSGMIVSHGR